MRNTAKKVARMIASLLCAHGVKEAVISPGSRNAPLIVAVERHPRINTRVVIDERSAAFIALGMSNAAGSLPVALVCTSGTAALNYAPAIAEAFYRHAPLVVITADRPSEWIDQDDSQTIKQPGIYNNFIKGSFDIPVESDEPDRMWMINRTVNDAISLATDGLPGPVHINVRLADPLGDIEEIDDNDTYGDEARCINICGNSYQIDPASIASLSEQIKSPAKVLVLAGFMEACGLDDALNRLAQQPNIVVMHEAQSNLHKNNTFISNIDATLRYIGAELDERYTPDIVITLGGSLTSRMVKEWLRRCPSLKHWSIGVNDHAIDCFRKLALRLSVPPAIAMKALADGLENRQQAEILEFKQYWLDAKIKSFESAEEWAQNSPWCDFKAVHSLLKAMPERYNLQLSNGTAVRYVQLFDYSKASRIDCNRGVSGIDGCTSTAIGAALMSRNPTVLITGDMSMQYDIGALACTFIPDNFKIVVLNNGGGGIFRFIRTTRNLEELQRDFVADVRLPLAKLSEAYGFNYYSAADESEFNHVITDFFEDNYRPSILEIVTDGEISASNLRKFFGTK